MSTSNFNLNKRSRWSGHPLPTASRCARKNTHAVCVQGYRPICRCRSPRCSIVTRFSVAIRNSAAARATPQARIPSASLTRQPVSARVRASGKGHGEKRIAGTSGQSREPSDEGDGGKGQRDGKGSWTGSGRTMREESGTIERKTPHETGANLTKGGGRRDSREEAGWIAVNLSTSRRTRCSR